MRNQILFRSNTMPRVQWKQRHRDGEMRKHTGLLFQAEGGVRSITFYIIRRDGKTIRKPASRCRIERTASLPCPVIVSNWKKKK